MSKRAPSFIGDLRTVSRMVMFRSSGRTHKERLEEFYRAQAGDYDEFRRRLLPGREALFRSIHVPEGATWVDMGAGTGSNLEFIRDRIPSLGKVYLVDLSPSLLAVARERIAKNDWRNVETIEADATRFRPPTGTADIVTFSFSLTMIPDWFSAIDAARRILKPGGTIGVVDFYVARKHPGMNRRRHDWSTRAFWPLWFAHDNVFLSPDHLPCLMRRFQTTSLVEGRSSVPYIPFIRVPYYSFLGRR